MRTVHEAMQKKRQDETRCGMTGKATGIFSVGRRAKLVRARNAIQGQRGDGLGHQTSDVKIENELKVEP